jgi:hypothetical protein
MDTGLEDVYTIVTALRWSHSLAARVLGKRTPEELHRDMLKALSLTTEPALQSLLLSVFEENATFLHPTADCVRATMQVFEEMLDRSPEGMASVQAEVVVAATTLLVEFDALLNLRPLLEVFVERLYNIIINVNNAADVLLRQAAAESLLELEEAFPGLLHEFVFDVFHQRSALGVQGLLYSLFVGESSHVRHSYLALFLACVEHATWPELGDVGQKRRSLGGGGDQSTRSDRETMFFEVLPSVVELHKQLRFGGAGRPPPPPAHMCAALLAPPRCAISGALRAPPAPRVADKILQCLSVVLDECWYLAADPLANVLPLVAQLLQFCVQAAEATAGGAGARIPLQALQLRQHVSSLLTKGSAVVTHVASLFALDAGPARLERSDRVRAARQLAQRLSDPTADAAVRVVQAQLLAIVLDGLKGEVEYAPPSLASAGLGANIVPEHFAGGVARQGEDENNAATLRARRGAAAVEGAGPNGWARLAWALFPSSLDPDLLKDAKLQCLVRFFECAAIHAPLALAAADAETAAKGRPSPAGVRQATMRERLLMPPRDLLEYAQCFSDFAAGGPQRLKAEAAAGFVTAVMLRFPGVFDEPCASFFARLLVGWPHLTPLVVAAVARIATLVLAAPRDSPLRAAACVSLRTLERAVVDSRARVRNSSRLIGVLRELALVESQLASEEDAARNPSMSPDGAPQALVPLFTALVACVEAAVESSEWAEGSAVLELCATLVLRHQAVPAAQHLVRFLAVAHPDADTRDQAALLLRVLFHCSPPQAERVLLALLAKPAAPLTLAGAGAAAPLLGDSTAPLLPRSFLRPQRPAFSSALVSVANAERAVEVVRALAPLRPALWTPQNSALGAFLYPHVALLEELAVALPLVSQRPLADDKAKEALPADAGSAATVAAESDARGVPQYHRSLAPPGGSTSKAPRPPPIASPMRHTAPHETDLSALRTLANPAWRPFDVIPASVTVDGGRIVDPQLLEVEYLQALLHEPVSAVGGADGTAGDISPRVTRQQLYIRYTETCAQWLARDGAGEGFPREIFGVVVQLQPDGAFQPVKPVVLPFLSAPAGVEAAAPAAAAAAAAATPTPATAVAEEKERFPFVYRFTVALEPLEPAPTTLACTLIFNDQRGNTCQGSLQPVPVMLHDLFLPLPIPAHLESKWQGLAECVRGFDPAAGSHAGGEAAPQLAREGSAQPPGDGTRLSAREALSAVLFTLMWDSILFRSPSALARRARERGRNPADAVADYGAELGELRRRRATWLCVSCGESVRHLQIPQSLALERLQLYLARFLVRHVASGSYGRRSPLRLVRAHAICGVRACVRACVRTYVRACSVRGRLGRESRGDSRLGR